MLTMVPPTRVSRRSQLAHELHQIANDRRERIASLRGALGERCDAPLAEELAKLLAQDGQTDDVHAFGQLYLERCGENTTVRAWARAPRP
jgi:hypothetical protein